MSLWIVVFVPFVLALAIPFLDRKFRNIHTGWFVAWLPFLLFIGLILQFPTVWRGQGQIESIPWIPSLDVNLVFYLDGVSLLFALLITGIGTLVTVYSVYYLAKETERLNHFYVYLLTFMGAMLGVVLSDNLIVLYTFWELTSISSFLLIGYWNHRERSRYGALKSLLITVMGGFAMLAGLVLLGQVTGSYSLREVIASRERLVESPLYLGIILLILAGAFTKSAQFPFHIWLPDAMEAPTPVSAYLHSATMVKAGLYLVARLTPALGGTAGWFWIVSAVGLMTLFWGSLMAIKQTDLKAILAFSTVSQLGLIMALLGYGTEVAVTAAVFHIINHATFKGSLFMAAGIVDHETGTRDIKRLGGLARVMPITAAIAFFGVFSMAGIPPLNGFLSKEMFFSSSVDIAAVPHAGVENLWFLFPLVAFIGSIFTFVYSMMFFFKTFWGPVAQDKWEKHPHEGPVGMWLAPIVLTFLVVILGLFPNLVANPVLAPAVEAVLGQPVASIHIQHFHGFDLPLVMTLTVIVAGTLIFWQLSRWLALYNKSPQWLNANLLYDESLRNLERGSRALTRVQMTGHLRDYVAYLSWALVLLILGTLLVKRGLAFNPSGSAPIYWYEWVLVLIILGSTLCLPYLSSRISVMVALGAVGYSVVLFFINFRAPDLALTQIIVETVTVILLLLGFVHMPRLEKIKLKRSIKVKNLLISIAVGITVTLLAFSAHSTRLFTPIADYYLTNSHKLGGGDNVVNVILVDFRGLDTLFEITVLGIAALSIYALIRFKYAENHLQQAGQKDEKVKNGQEIGKY